MKISTLFAAIAIALVSIAPASALTQQQAMDSIAGMYCSGSTCTSETTGTRTEATPGAPIVSGGYSEPTDPDKYVEKGFSSSCTWGNGKPMLRVNPVTCAAESLVGPGSTTPTVTGYGPAGSKTINTVTTTTKELVYNGPNTSRDTAWDVITTTQTVDVP